MNKRMIILAILTLLLGCVAAEQTPRSRQSEFRSSSTKTNGEKEGDTRNRFGDQDDDDGGADGAEGDDDDDSSKEKKPKKNRSKLVNEFEDQDWEDNRSQEEILCEDGLRRSNAPKKDDFTTIFRMICDGDQTNQTFRDVVAAAYNGSGEPNVTVVRNETTDMFVTTLHFVYAIEVPLSSPKYFADIKIYERLDGQGIEHTTSRLQTDVKSREDFPGEGSVEEVRLNHQLQLANGAALFDRRNTEINNYLLIENTRDITLSTEHLVDEDNEHYHIARGILAGLKSITPGNTILLYVNELVIKNRIDPERLTTTIINLSKATQKTIYEQAASAQE